MWNEFTKQMKEKSFTVIMREGRKAGGTFLKYIADKVPKIMS